MSNNVPVVRQFAWISILPHVVVICLFLWLFYHLVPTEAYVYYALVSYLVFSFGLRYFLAGDQRKGMTLLRNHYFEAALPYFERSVAFFTKNEWVDKYRYITLLASSRMSYREMGLCNMAYCYSQMDERQKAKALYEQIHTEYPENGIAISALEMIRDLEKESGE